MPQLALFGIIVAGTAIGNLLTHAIELGMATYATKKALDKMEAGSTSTINSSSQKEEEKIQ